MDVCVFWAACVVTLHFGAPVHSLAGVALGLLLVFRTNSLRPGSGRADIPFGELAELWRTGYVEELAG